MTSYAANFFIEFINWFILGTVYVVLPLATFERIRKIYMLFSPWVWKAKSEARAFRIHRLLKESDESHQVEVLDVRIHRNLKSRQDSRDTRIAANLNYLELVGTTVRQRYEGIESVFPSFEWAILDVCKLKNWGLHAKLNINDSDEFRKNYKSRRREHIARSVWKYTVGAIIVIVGPILTSLAVNEFQRK